MDDRRMNSTKRLVGGIVAIGVVAAITMFLRVEGLPHELQELGAGQGSSGTVGGGGLGPYSALGTDFAAIAMSDRVQLYDLSNPASPEAAGVIKPDANAEIVPSGAFGNLLVTIQTSLDERAWELPSEVRLYNVEDLHGAYEIEAANFVLPVVRMDRNTLIVLSDGVITGARRLDVFDVSLTGMAPVVSADVEEFSQVAIHGDDIVGLRSLNPAGQELALLRIQAGSVITVATTTISESSRVSIVEIRDGNVLAAGGSSLRSFSTTGGELMLADELTFDGSINRVKWTGAGWDVITYDSGYSDVFAVTVASAGDLSSVYAGQVSGKIGESFAIGDMALLETSRGFEVYDRSSGILEEMVPGESLRWSFGDVELNSSFVYAADEEHGIHVIDASDPDDLILTHSITMTGGAERIAAEGSMMIAAGKYGLSVFDASTPSNPVVSGSVAWSSVFTSTQSMIAGDIDVSTGVAVTSVSLFGGLVIDVSNPSVPTVEGLFLPGKFIIAVEVANTTVFALTERGTLYAFSIADLGSPVLLDEVEFENSHLDLELTGDYLYLGDAYGGVTVVDTSNPSDLTVVSVLNFDNDPTEFGGLIGLELSGGNHLYGLWSGIGVRIFNISDPLAVYQEEVVDLLEWEESFAVGPDFVIGSQPGSIRSYEKGLFGDWSVQDLLLSTG